MTREEAKDMFNIDRDSYGKIKGVAKKIDKIYDDFESRTQEKCEDCLHHPKKGENFKEICGMCGLFYGSSWKMK